MANISITYKHGAIDKDGRTFAYGQWINPWRPIPNKPDILMPRPMWSIEKEIYWRLTCGSPVPPGAKDRKWHFMRFVDEIWGTHDSMFPFQWNPIAESILEKKLEHKFLMVGGHAGSGKSIFAALWGVANFMFDPFNTKVLATSMTLKSAKGKIWGSISECWQQASRAVAQSYGEKNMANAEKYMTGVLLSDGIIRYKYNSIESEKAGLELVPGGVDKAKDSADKIQGYHRGRVFALLDELATLDHGLMKTVESNIYTNAGADILGTFNPDTHYDPAGKASEPINGWTSVTEDMDGWQNKMGWTMRIDGAKSPNVVAGYEKYKGLLSHAEFESQKIALGENSKEFHKMYRAWFSTAGLKDAIYSDQEIEEYEANIPVTLEWVKPPTPCAFLDPSFAHGGDRSIATLGLCGAAQIKGKVRQVLSIQECVRIDADVHSKLSKPRQVAAQYIALCKQFNVEPKNAGLDATGSQIGDLISTDWSGELLEVGFGEVASDAPVSAVDPTPSKEKYSRKVDEIWYAAKPLIRCHQFKGIPAEVITEMTARNYKTQNGKIKVETKDEMKERCLRSPDYADSCLGLVYLCRQRLNLTPIEAPGLNVPGRPPMPISVQPSRVMEVYDTGLSFSGGSALWD